MSSEQVLYFPMIDEIVNNVKYDLIDWCDKLYYSLIEAGLTQDQLDIFQKISWIDQLNTDELLNYNLFRDKVRKNIGKNPDPNTDFFIQKYICDSRLSLMHNLLETEDDIEGGFKDYYELQIEAQEETDEENDIDEVDSDEETDEGYEEMPEPQADVKPEPKVKSKPEPQADVKTEPKVKSKPEPKVKSKPEPKVELKTEPKVKSKPELQADVKTEPKVKSKPELQIKYTIHTNYENRDIVLIEGPDQESLRQHFSESLLKKLFLNKEDKWIITRNNGINAEHNVNELVDAFEDANVPFELIKSQKAKVSKPPSKLKESEKTPSKKVLPKPTKNSNGNLADSNIVFLSLYTSKNKKFTLAIGRQNTKSNQKGLDSVLRHNKLSEEFCKSKGWDKFLITPKRWENIQKFEDEKIVDKLTKLAPKP
ncbi:hypothetical protein OAG24_00115 [bacterium]|nr:hypothetical protein [bacterium]